MSDKVPLKVESEGVPQVETLPEDMLRFMLSRLNITRKVVRLDDYKESRDLSPIVERPE